jgi:D-alanyl-D-alanine carboxypeptidase
MNKKAKSLSMSNTNFSNPHGLVGSLNYSSVKDISVLCRYCLKNTNFIDIVNTKSYSYSY